jgi:3-oxoacyl-[acyl-carrier-protein] synthase-1
MPLSRPLDAVTHLAHVTIQSRLLTARSPMIPMRAPRRGTDYAIVGVGARTPVGLTAASTAAAVRGGISRICEHPFLVDPRGDSLLAAFDGRLDPSLPICQRLIALGTSALVEMLAPLHEPSRPRNMTAFVALPEERPGFSAADADKTLQGLEDAAAVSGTRVRVEAAGAGHAGALRGLQVALERLVPGSPDLVAVGGVESYFDAATLEWLASQRRLSAEGVRSGFHPGEGAGFLLVGSSSVARSLRLSPLAAIRGVASGVEDCSSDKGVEVFGRGLAATIAAAAELRLPDEAVDAVFCDINGERYRSQEWGMAVLHIQQMLRSSAYEAPVDCWGDMGAASGALSCVLAAQSWRRNYARGPRALVWASSDRGLRGAAVLEQPAN